MTKIELAHCFFILGEPALQASQTHIHGSTLRNVVSSRRAVGLSATMFLAQNNGLKTVSVAILCHVEFSIGFYHDKILVLGVEVDMFWASLCRVREPASLVNHVSFAIL